MRALIVEDDPRYGAHLAQLLERGGFLADWERDAEAARMKGEDSVYAVIILDLMLSTGDGVGARAVDGFSLLRGWRKKGVGTPVLVLTASRTDIEDTTQSYEWDADYEVKRPGAEFDALLLAWARSRAARRPSAGGVGAAAGGRLTVGGLAVDLERREATFRGAAVPLSDTEFKVLAVLAQAGEGYATGDHIARSAFGDRCENPNAQLYEYIKRLRQKLGFGAIRNQRGRGYRLEASGLEGGACGDR